jgi:hypothetical protein
MKRESRYPKKKIDVTGLPEEAVHALESFVSLLRQHPGSAGGNTPKVLPGDLIGLFRDEPDLLDEIVEDAMKARETQPLRLPRG